MASSQYRALEKRLYEIRDNHVLTIGKLDDIPCIPRQENIDRIWKAQEAKLEKARKALESIGAEIVALGKDKIDRYEELYGIYLLIDMDYNLRHAVSMTWYNQKADEAEEVIKEVNKSDVATQGWYAAVAAFQQIKHSADAIYLPPPEIKPVREMELIAKELNDNVAELQTELDDEKGKADMWWKHWKSAERMLAKMEMNLAEAAFQEKRAFAEYYTNTLVPWAREKESPSRGRSPAPPSGRASQGSRHASPRPGSQSRGAPSSSKPSVGDPRSKKPSHFQPSTAPSVGQESQSLESSKSGNQTGSGKKKR